MKIIKGLLLFVLPIVLLYGCCQTDFVTVKVRKSAFIPDKFEINRDSLIEGGIRICKMGQRYYHKPEVKGGGGNSFIGFAIPPHLAETKFGVYIMSVKNNMIKVVGKGKIIGYDGMGPAEVEFVSNPNFIISTAIKN